MKLLVTKLIKTGKETNMYDSTWGSCFKHIVYSGSKVVCFPNIKRLPPTHNGGKTFNENYFSLQIHQVYFKATHGNTA